MNSALHASPPTESTHGAHPERDLSITLPREEELRRLSLAQRVALRVALRLIVRVRVLEHDLARCERERAHELLRAQTEQLRIRHTLPRQML
ncbi:MAG: hypothetical protein JSS74_13705 [Actinobacteria bacterium]|nr:hypothetical protein [Actinomycetota bacterium]